VISGDAVAQTLPPGFGEDTITYRSEPFQIELDTLMQGIEDPNRLQEIIEGRSGLSLPGQVEGLYILPRIHGDKEDIQTCQVICVGESGGEPCFNTCGFFAAD